MSVEQAMADINIAAAVAIRLAAGKIEVSFVGRQGGRGLPGLGIDAVAHVFRRAPAVWREVGNIKVAASMSFGKITTGEDQPLSILGDVLGAFILIGIDITGQAPGLAPRPILFVRFVEVFVEIIDAAVVDWWFSTDYRGGARVGDSACNAVCRSL